MTPNASWLDVVRVVRGLSNRWEGPPVCGDFHITTEDDLRSLQGCLNAQHDTHCELTNHGNSAALVIGQSIEISISPRLAFGLLKHDIKALLADVRKTRIKEPLFFLMANDISNTDVVVDDHLVSRYRVVLEFIQLLKRAAAFLDIDELSLVFIKDGKFELSIEYGADDLQKLSLPVIRELLKILPEGMHEKQCAAILADAVISLTEHLPIDQRFKYLLVNASDLKKQFEQGYQLFAAGFSYEKVRDEVEAARVDYTGKIHKVFADIQNQLLGIPVATIIVATQMKDVKAIGYEFWVNTSVLVGSWVFSILMLFLIHNQSHTLGVLRDEIDRQKRQLKKEYSAVADSFSSTFDYLSKRVNRQHVILWAIDGFVFLGFIISHAVYLKLTPPARDWVVSCLPWLARWF